MDLPSRLPGGVSHEAPPDPNETLAQCRGAMMRCNIIAACALHCRYRKQAQFSIMAHRLFAPSPEAQRLS
jgi:hypothetical protein